MNSKCINAIFAAVGHEYLVPNLNSLDCDQFQKIDPLLRNFSTPITLPGLFFGKTVSAEEIQSWWDSFVDIQYPHWKTEYVDTNTMYTCESLTLPYESIATYMTADDIHHMLCIRCNDDTFLSTDIHTYPEAFQRRIIDMLFYRDGDKPEYLFNFFEECLTVDSQYFNDALADYLHHCILHNHHERVDVYLALFDPRCMMAQWYPHLSDSAYFLSIAIPFKGDVSFQQHTILTALKEEEPFLEEISEERVECYVSYLQLLLQHGNTHIQSEVKRMINTVLLACPNTSTRLSYQPAFTADDASFFH